MALPELIRAGLFLLEFEAENAGRTNTHRHLFMLPDQQGHRDADYPEVIVAVGSVPMAAWVRLLQQGEDGIEVSGWGKIEDLTVDFLHSGMAMQVSKADLDNAGDGEGNSGGMIAVCGIEGVQRYST